ncbi:MAG: DsbA family protein [Pseudomonadota bacterium]
MTDELRVYFHFRSPYSRIGLHRLAQASVDEKISTRLFLLTKVADQDSFPNPGRTPARRIYLMQDVPRVTTKAGLAIQMPDPLDPPYGPAVRAFLGAEKAGRSLAFALAVSNARWGEGKNISDEAVLAECAAQAGAPLTLASDEEMVAAKGLSNQQIDADGVFGVPFAVLEKDGHKERFFGQDRFDLLIEQINS